MLNKMIRKAARFAIAPVALGAALLVPSVADAAGGLSCSVNHTVSAYSSTTKVSCGGWTGYREFRARQHVEAFLNSYEAYGPWVPIDGTATSSVTTYGWYTSGAGYQLR